MTEKRRVRYAPHPEEQPGQPHGMDSASHNKHLQMAEAIADCQTLLCHSMEMGAYENRLLPVRSWIRSKNYIRIQG